MSLPKNILFPVDFSERCRAVWPAVQGMARQLEIPVTLFHVLDIQEYVEVPEIATHFQAIRGRLRTRLDDFVRPTPNGISIQRELEEGPAAARIVQRAADLQRAAGIGSPLIMLPTRGHTRFRQLLLGSVTASVLHDAACPVWTAAHTEHEVPYAGPYRTMVCALDMAPRTPELLKFACELSARFGAALHCTHAIPRCDAHFPSGPAQRAHELLTITAREDFQLYSRTLRPDLTLEIVEEPDLVEGILGAARRYGADLLLVGRGVIDGPLGRLRTHAHELIRRSPCAVLSV